MRTFPAWLNRPVVRNGTVDAVEKIIAGSSLHTVCSSAKCPNRGECFSRRTAAFLILGNLCSRQCGFCAVPGGSPAGKPDADEVAQITSAVWRMGLTYAVITSVTRDDLPDGGAGQYADMIRSLKDAVPGIKVEVLIPDLQGDSAALQTIVDAGPDVLNHNIETVRGLYPRVRMGADYDRSLTVLARAKDTGAGITKSGLMLGLGETGEEISRTMDDLRTADCDILTLGQYLKPGAGSLPVERFVTPEKFDVYREEALDKGFKAVAAGPYVRSSYDAENCYRTLS